MQTARGEDKQLAGQLPHAVAAHARRRQCVCLHPLGLTVGPAAAHRGGLVLIGDYDPLDGEASACGRVSVAAARSAHSRQVVEAQRAEDVLSRGRRAGRHGKARDGLGLGGLLKLL